MYTYNSYLPSFASSASSRIALTQPHRTVRNHVNKNLHIKFKLPAGTYSIIKIISMVYSWSIVPQTLAGWLPHLHSNWPLTLLYKCINGCFVVLLTLLL